MSRIPLESFSIEVGDPVFSAISTWPFEEEFFCRILLEDIPQRAKFEFAKIWAYRDPEKTIVGFGSLTWCSDYRDFTDNKEHAYIPLLGVHPDKRKLGHGTTIVNHLVQQATNYMDGIRNDTINQPSKFIFLDVYEDSIGAINLYEKSGFQVLGGCTFPDPTNNKNFYVIAKRLLQ